MSLFNGINDINTKCIKDGGNIHEKSYNIWNI